ncbi:hypothetical protein RJ639_044731 [Escallonia herrerae]|uniref:Uncharacterized protein n=1 Tax=Escallonia herrerae TaxID=1293975 RepID=A0AA89B2G5_9ASTE|nr:hypothetical protein RJ639_044731 [Escallonia herrerae]
MRACRIYGLTSIYGSANKVPSLKRTTKKTSLWSLRREGCVAAASSSDPKGGVSGNGYDGVDPFRGKLGLISFKGLTQQLVEEGRLVSAPYDENAGSFLWVLAPVALILSIVLPQFLLDLAIGGVLQDEILSVENYKAASLLILPISDSDLQCGGKYYSVHEFDLAKYMNSFSHLYLYNPLTLGINGWACSFVLNRAAEIVASSFSQVMFYVGLAVFLHVTDHFQKPYLQFSPKRWGLITGLRGYLTSAFFTMGLKVFAPLFAVFVTWPIIGLPALVSVAPFLASCLAQFVFEKHLQKRGSSSWPLLPIIFEVYRLYQLSKAAHLVEKLMMSMKGVPVSPEVLERSGALVALLVTFQVLGLVCLWSLLTFLQRLFPSRPVAENY